MENIWTRENNNPAIPKGKNKFSWLRGKKIIAAVLVAGILIVIGIVSAVVGGSDYEYATEPVKRGDLIQTVEATGSVKPSAKLDLNFKSSGKLFRNYIKVGDFVEEGQLLSELEAKDALLEVERARSSLALAYANLNLKLAGESAESLKVYEEEVAKARSNLNKAQTDFENAIKSNQESIREAELNVSKYEIALSKAEADLKNTGESDIQAIINAYDNVRVTLKSNVISVSTAMTDMDNVLGVDNKAVNDSFEGLLGILKLQTKVDAVSVYELAATNQAIVEPLVENLSVSSSYTEIKSIIGKMKALLVQVSDALGKTRLMLDNTVTGTDLSAITLDSHKTTINTDRSAINTALTNLQTKEQDILNTELSQASNLDTYTSAVETAQNNLDSAKQALDKAKVTADNSFKAAQAQVEIMESSLASAQATLALKKASPREVDLASLRAQVEEAKVSLELAEDNLENTKIKAPVAGVISAINYKVGEQVSLGGSSVSILPVISIVGNEEDLRIEVDISESDIPKINTGDKVEITFDAFGQDKKFEGEVISVDPAETVIQDVVYYQVDINIINGIEKVKPGMTANVEIFTDRREDVLYIPQRAIIRKNGEQLARILEKGEPVEVSVETGLRANDGLIEIISGLKEGEEVITHIKENK